MFLFSLLGTVIATFLGAFIGIFSYKFPKKIILFLQNFSVGAIISFLFLELIVDAFEHMNSSQNNNILSVLYVCLIIFATGLLFFILHELVHHFSKHHHDDNNDEHACIDHAHTKELFDKNKSLLITSFIFLGAIFVHNIPEGLVLGLSFVSEESVPLNGIILSSIMFIHNLIIGFSMSISFIQNNETKGKTLLWTTLSALPAFILSIIGYFIGSIQLNDIYIAILLSISSGSLFYVLFIELFPQIYYQYKSKYSFLFVLFGFCVLSTILAI